jgi:plasmid stabilization system protein ParE
MADLEAIGEYIAQDNPGAALAWVERLQQRANAAATAPNAGRVVPERGRSDIREVFLRSYRIVYRVDGDDVVVLTVFEGHRSLGLLEEDG